MLAHKKKSRQLFVFFGMVAAGKSYLARTWSSRNNLPYFNTDAVRKELAGLEAGSRQSGGIGEGIYAASYTRKTYDELITRAGQAYLDEGVRLVVLDGSYGDPAERKLVITSFEDMAEIYFIYCQCPEELVKERIEKRASDPRNVSDGNWEIYCAQKKNFSLPEDMAGAHLVKINTDRPVELLMKEIDQLLAVRKR